MKNSIKTILAICVFAISAISSAQKSPTFEKGNDPRPKDKKWKLVKNQSDEFKGSSLNKSKWVTGGGWIGRPPGLFMQDNIKVEDGSLKITAYTLPQPIVKNKKTFTLGGGYVGSVAPSKYGNYEARMKANKTFMSSTFWLINEGRNESGCNKRTVELDIQECVGEINTKGKWAQHFDRSMHSNTHSRNIPEGCDYVKGIQGTNTDLKEGMVYDDDHVYGAWWKSETEVWFYLDGVLTEKVTPAADFDINMQIRMVVETYDSNPVPPDGGMTGTEKERTTSYDWVRVWRLK